MQWPPLVREGGTNLEPTLPYHPSYRRSMPCGPVFVENFKVLLLPDAPVFRGASVAVSGRALSCRRLTLQRRRTMSNQDVVFPDRETV
jgi:hypothetical protein